MKSIGMMSGLCLVFLFTGLFAQNDPTSILLKNYRPVSLFEINRSKVTRARYTAIDMHSHPYANGAEEIARWVNNMDKSGIRKTIILTKANSAAFDSIYALYAVHADRFDLWCGFDLSGYLEPDFPSKAVLELERCAKMGAKGVGEISDKGSGLIRGVAPEMRLYLDDPRLDLLWRKCGELGLPVNVHVADPIWMYQPMDSTNDGLMNALSLAAR